MILKKVTDSRDSALSFIKPLYEHSFPLHERREWEQLLQSLREPSVELLVIQQHEELIGFAILWKLDGWHYLEHFAIDPKQRSKKYGSKVMELLKKHCVKGLILEVEPPIEEMAKRRIGFYERLGFIICPFEYQQPPYRKGEDWHPMLLMSVPEITSESAFEHIATTIHTEVYTRFY